MVKFIFSDDQGRTHLGLGVSRENITRLTAGRAIRVQLAELQTGLAITGDVVIYFEETDRDLQQAVAEFIGPETKVNIEPRLKEKL